MAQTCLVTGAAGFIGSNLCLELLRRGYRVVGVDNFFSGKRANLDRVAAFGGGSFRFIEADIRDRAAMDQVVQGCQSVVHLAAQVSVQRSMDDAAETNAINVDGFLNVLLASAAAGIKRFIYASSCAVYGDNPALPLAETEAPRPLSPYAASKLINEHYAQSLAPRLGGMECFGFRFFNVFGPWQDPAGGYAAVIPKWVDLCRRGQRPVMFGDGSATRDFVYVGNICAMMATAADQSQALPSGIYNLGTGARTSLSGLFDTIRRSLMRAGIDVAFESPDTLPWRDGDILHSAATIAKAAGSLSYSPKIDLEKGIDLMLGLEYGLGRVAV